MSDKRKKSFVLVNVLIVLVSLILIGVLVQKFYLSEARFTANLPAKGIQFPVDGLDFSSKEKNLVLVLSRTCRFCSESIPFYLELVRTAQYREDIRFIALMAGEPHENQEYLNSAGLTSFEASQVNLEGLGINATPTLLIINKNGVIVDSWVGKLTPEVEKEVIYKMVS